MVQEDTGFALGWLEEGSQTAGRFDGDPDILWDKSTAGICRCCNKNLVLTLFGVKLMLFSNMWCPALLLLL